MSSGKKPQLLVFTDLDATLLDHDTYSFEPAKSTLERLKKNNIPVIPTTSKTLAEIDAFSIDFSNVAKIGENGQVIQLPDGGLLIPGKSYQEIREILDTLPQNIRSNINGFGDMSVAQVQEHTGLDEASATLAKNRSASEPFLWNGDDAQMEILKEALAPHGLHLTQGGRFYHIISEGGKDTAIQCVTKMFDNAVTVSLGDGPNDAGMLATANYGVKIPNHHGKDFKVQNPKGEIIEAKFAGPEGWADSMESLLDELGFDR